MNPISRLTKEYTLGALTEGELDRDPLKMFERWLQAAINAGVQEPSAMTLATATREGAPSARVVLLKDFNAHGFAFYTNYRSQKGRELESNPQAALLFFWPALERQVRITGTVTQVSRQESEEYFHTRPLGSQIGTWASHQSEVIVGREDLDRRFHQLEAEYKDKIVPLPPSWGGYRLYPLAIEFWQGGPSRLHDRFRYRRIAESSWKIERLAP